MIAQKSLENWKMEIYSTQCIESKLVPFLKTNYPEDNYIFWPDGASSHYSKSTLETYKRLNIKFVGKVDTPPNVPQLRPIEIFWSHLKNKVYYDNWEASDAKSLENESS